MVAEALYAMEDKNPESLPVDRLSLVVTTGGVVRTVKALDPHWVEVREWTLYYRLPRDEGLLVGALDAWTSNANALIADLKFLLSLRHHRFWSYMLYEPRCLDMLVSFLQEAEPPYLAPPAAPPQRLAYEQLRGRVASVFCRLVTERESDSEWMTREHLGRVIYDDYLFSIPTLWDLCLVYGTDNSQAIGRLVRAVFTLQPRYKADLETAIAFVQEVFKYTIVQVNNKYDSTFETPNLPETFKGFSEIKRPQKEKATPEKLTFSVLRDLIVHLLDSALTIRTFTELYPAGVEALKKRAFVLSIVQLYENAIPCMYEKLDELGDESARAYSEVTAQLETLRGELVDIVREVLAAETDAILCQQGNTERHVADYFAAMMDVLSEKTLIRDYNAAYPVHEDLEMLRQAYPDMDSVKTDFILQAVYSNLDEPAPVVPPDPAPSTSTVEQREESQTAQQTTIETDIPSDLKEESLISEVKDILPHLGEGFILKCLQHYGFNSERVINSILEGSLDQTLRSLDQSLPIIPADALDERFLETGIARLNVFDGDEFDVMTRDDVDVTRIHRGKRREQFKDLKQMLDDKSHVRQQMEVYRKYNLVVEDENLYSDEYDDTYDSVGGGGAPGRDDAHDEPRRPLVKPRVLQQMEPQSEESSSEDETERTPGGPQAGSAGARAGAAGGKSMDFCVNPELLRARREANRRANDAKKPGRPPPKGLSSYSKKTSATNIKVGDVVGKAKGQGQEKEVLVSREKKNQNKSSRANHNRRHGAQWKRTQGMVPS